MQAPDASAHPGPRGHGRMTEQRDLDSINGAMFRPQNFISMGALLPFAMGLCGWALAEGAAPDVPTRSNPLALLCLFVCSAAIMLAIIPRMSGWDWDTRYFGAGGWLIGSFALMGGIPWLCILIYSRAPWWIRGALFSLYALAHAWGAWRRIRLYRHIFADDEMRNQLYVEAPACFYYVQKADRQLLEKTFKFEEMPTAPVIVGSIVLACVVMLFGVPLVQFFGIPIPHLVLAALGVSMDTMASGLLVRCWLIFYHYPMRLLRATGKVTYVDMGSKSSARIKLKKAT